MRSEQYRVALEEVVLARLTTARHCRRKANRPPGAEALRAAAALPGHERDVAVLLDRYAGHAEASP